MDYEAPLPKRRTSVIEVLSAAKSFIVVCCVFTADVSFVQEPNLASFRSHKELQLAV